MLILFLLVESSMIQYAALHGNVEELGYYYVDIWVGTPPMKQTVIVDTGSRITAFPCIKCEKCGSHLDTYFDYSKSSTGRMVRCTQGIPCSSCKKGECHYSQAYVEGSSIEGVLVEDYVRFGDNFNLSEPVKFKFGCHRSQTKLFKSQLADGVMGLAYPSRNMDSLYDALYEAQDIVTSIFAICLAKEGGIMAIGGFNTSYHQTEIQWVPLYGQEYFGIKVHDIFLNGESLGLEQQDFSDRYTSGTIIDSGTTFVYLSHKVHSQFFRHFFAYCENQVSCRGNQTQTQCYSYEQELSGTIQQFFQSFPIISFAIQEILVDWVPQGYLVEVEPELYCVGVLNNGNRGNVLGSVFMRGRDVVFNKIDRQVGFAYSDCEARLEEYTEFKQNTTVILENKEEVGQGISWGVISIAGFSLSALLLICVVTVWIRTKKTVYSEILETEDQNLQEKVQVSKFNN